MRRFFVSTIFLLLNGVLSLNLEYFFSGTVHSAKDKSSSGSNSSSSGNPGTDNLSSSGTVDDGFKMLSNFEGDLPENIMGYVFGNATVQNDSLDVLDEDEEPTGEKYAVWNPNDILTLKDFSFNGATDKAENGGGLIIKDIDVKKYAAFRFKARGTVTASNLFQFRIKEGEKSACGQNFKLTSEEEFNTFVVNIPNPGLNVIYPKGDYTRDDCVENSDQIEFSMQADGTLEIYNLEGLEKE
jgi:hypothetical protein